MFSELNETAQNPIGEEMEISKSDKKCSFLKMLRIKNLNRLIIGSLNINFLEPKIDQLKVFVENTLDILVIVETKLDNSVKNGVLAYSGYQPFRVDRNKYQGGIFVFIRDNIPCKVPSTILQKI